MPVADDGLPLQVNLMDHVFWYQLVKVLHIVSVVAWMAGLLYLPRLFVYHVGVKPGSEASETFKIMESKLLRLIMNPAMIATWVFGIILAVQLDAFQQGWLHAKLLFVLLLTVIHHMLARHRKQFAADANVKTAKYYRILNEVPAVALIIIVTLVIFKPF